MAAVEIQACGIPCLFSDRVAYETKINQNVEFFSLNESNDVINTKIKKTIGNG
ncbi:glycosyltransferase family 1 protein [Roseburia sp. AM59-24XD]|uniref:glycosyltransferase family 1 protein n=1 Tax=Roseburia sp. AM59-24XD TaxID=2293138 RepID=UPI0011C3D2A0|nr:glycosyltransferase family 1 protein [Roseburia sp. AM59-24XD]